jgi:hypothetical protein
MPRPLGVEFRRRAPLPAPPFPWLPSSCVDSCCSMPPSGDT